jgi:TM2 domain-containing membrane protein YozV
MNSLYQYFPNLDMEEYNFLQNLIKDFSETQMQQFCIIYGSRRKDSQLILILALIGFLGFSGIHRFVLGQIGMGVLYFFTCGLCFIGTIVDLVNHKKLTFEYNFQQAHQAASMVK